MVPGVAGSSPVIRPSYKNTGVSAGIFITPVGSGFEPRFAYSVPVIAKEYDQRWKRWRTTAAIQCNMSAGIPPAVLFLFTGSPRFARDESEYMRSNEVQTE